MDSIDLILLSGDIAKTTRRAEEFGDSHETLQKNLQTYLPLTMDTHSGVHSENQRARIIERFFDLT